MLRGWREGLWAVALAAALWGAAAVVPAGAADAVASARTAIAALDAAQAELEAAEKSRDRVAALTQAVRAYEAGLEAVREGLRQVTQREDALARRFEAEEARLAAVLGALEAISAQPQPARLVHPGGPLEAVRGGMVLADLVPALEAEASRIRAQLEEVRTLRALQADAAATLGRGLLGAEAARTALSKAVSARVAPPPRFAEDAEAMDTLLTSAESLEALARALDARPLVASPVAVSPEALRGRLPLPALGRLLRGYGEADAAGIARPGIILATRPLALVTAPAAASVRYAGALPGQGKVLILEPAERVMIVMAGLGRLFVRTGDVVPAGAPLGLMGGGTEGLPDAIDQAVLIAVPEGSHSDHSESLYLEVRENEAPVDPAPWFALNKD